MSDTNDRESSYSAPTVGAGYDRIREQAEEALGSVLPELPPLPPRWSGPETPQPQSRDLGAMPSFDFGQVFPAESSVAFVLSRPDDETLVFSIEFDGQEPGEEMTRATYDLNGSSGMDLLETTVTRAAAAIGAQVVRR